MTVYLPGGQELTATGGVVKATRYYSFNGQVVAVRTGPGTAGVSTLVADHHGTAGLSIANTTRQVSRRYTDPYGAPRGTAPAAWAGDHGFLDKPVDTTGLKGHELQITRAGSCRFRAERVARHERLRL